MPPVRAPVVTPVWPWIVFVTVASLLLSRAFACATPLAALAALAALTLRGRDAVLLVTAAWLGNQAIGFGLMHYPRDGATVGWGLAIGVAALMALGAARLVVASAKPVRYLASAGAALFAGYAVYEMTLLAATTVLPSGAGAFTATVVIRILGINIVALALLLVARHLAEAAGVQATSFARPARV